MANARAECIDSTPQDAAGHESAARRDDARFARSRRSEAQSLIDTPRGLRSIHRRRKARSISRLASCFLSASRLSKVLRPRAVLNSTLAIPFLK